MTGCDIPAGWNHPQSPDLTVPMRANLAKQMIKLLVIHIGMCIKRTTGLVFEQKAQQTK